MAESCFFAQNLLSDYIEGILPAARSETIKSHLDGCATCRDAHNDMTASIRVLHALPIKPIHHELGLRIAEACEAGRPTLFVPRKMALLTFLVLIPLGFLLGAGFLFPELFPWLPPFRGGSEVRFVRYYPLLQGAGDILEEQGSWLTVRENVSGSLWEEGGLSPDEFERSFQLKSTREKGK